jgi:hypothetical protein
LSKHRLKNVTIAEAFLSVQEINEIAKALKVDSLSERDE